MRVTIVPAQVTTVEDRIMGNLGFSQLLLLIAPLFVGLGLFLVLPPFAKGSLYKYVVIVLITLVSIILSIRVRGKIILLWLITMLRYNLRPKFYLADKNTTAFRIDYPDIRKPKDAKYRAGQKSKSSFGALLPSEAAYALMRPGSDVRNLSFEMTKKGVLRVRFAEIKK